MKKSILAIVLVMAMLSTTGISYASGAVDIQTKPEIPQDSALLAVVQENIDAYKEHYILHSITVSNKSIHQVDNESIGVDFIVELQAELKYDSATELPHIQGMAAQLGIDSSKLTTTEFISNLSETNVGTSLKEIANESLSKSDSAKNSTNKPVVYNSDLVTNIAIEEIKAYVEEVESLYIGQTSPINLYFRALIDEKGLPTSVAAVAFDDSTYDAQLMVPESISTMRKNGAAQLENMVDTALVKAQNQSEYTSQAAAAVAATTYHRVTARDYANAWTSNPTKGSKDTTKWRISTNPNATAPFYPANTNDCANYVSQAIFAGGIPKTSTEVSDAYHWFASQWGCSAAWENCTHMHTFFTSNSYWTASDYANCNAGGVIFLKDGTKSTATRYHVVMCVQNDTVTRTYSAHTSDRKAVAYTGISSFGTDCKALEYWVFTNSSAD